ncbi:MAG: 2-keto-3-deoxy-D-arabino-heptulosonate-7-phosphate synthase [Labilithrix sp.]|nr:2-keto-3-deoxy-D-arabino-heptulosonate-7-phosphate synthase [Labilithrix sp.]
MAGTIGGEPKTAVIPKLYDDEIDGESEPTSHSDFNTLERAKLAGTPAYLVRHGGGHELFSLAEGDRRLGRSSTCDIRVNEAGVSRVHAVIRGTRGDYQIEDAGSANGTTLNGKLIAGAYQLKAGDRIGIGPVTFRFEHTPADEHGTTPVALAAWTPTSWKTKPAQQMPRYESAAEVDAVVDRIRTLPPLVTSWEIERLKNLMAEAQNGERFILQGGDCAETFRECDSTIITNKLKILLQMSLVLTQAARKPIVRIGRFAGQYAKPRSQPTETRDGVELPSYVGDLVNCPEFTAAARRHDPQLLLAGYHHASMTLNFIRALSAGGFSDLRRAEYFDLSVFERADLPSSLREDYIRMSKQVAEGLHFMRSFGTSSLDDLAKVEFFASHEGLNLVYESAQTRQVPNRNGHYCLSTHLPWIGDRTRALDSAHMEFFRGIANPVGVKVGPKSSPQEVVDALRFLNPSDEPGKVALIVRMGASAVQSKLPPLLQAVARSRRKVLWICDPMHGNGTATRSGLKTRNFDDILKEIEETFLAHEQAGTYFGGVHFELTGEDVTECIGGGLSEADLDTRYLTACDPRLNYRQAMEMAFRIAKRIGTSSVRRASSLPPPSSIVR